ncbi:HAD family hydrolase [Natronoglycomyces albus]|uniref:HAD family phosphatase n=1 Tax=Natronoglycomyces albus TaxID=2811108 RepID=A0A895XQ20_9ACTN|nr:HAD-IIB family hydrolase [Natronoglycomyces albus]QSB05215.1 HAD family phosphatase [Natronoglycomyces albus]
MSRFSGMHAASPPPLDPDTLGLKRLPKVVATDLDGTLVRSDSTVSEYSQTVLKRLQAAGVIVIGATGRGPRLLELSRRDVRAADYMVLGQGAFVYETAGESSVTLASKTIAGHKLLRAVEQIEAELGPINAAVEPVATDRTPLLGDDLPGWPYAINVDVQPRQFAYQGQLMKAIWTTNPPMCPQRMVDLATDIVDTDEILVIESGINFAELCPAGVSKANGLQVVLNRLGVGFDEVLAFGDASNDLPMLEAVGHAVAMPHATDNVKGVVNEVLPYGNDEDGVARYLEALLELA